MHLDREICWKDTQLPRLQTPVNSLDTIRTKRLLIAVRVTYADGTSDCIGTINCPLANMEETG